MKREFLFHRPREVDVARTLTWRAGLARMRRGTEATWQGRAWPARGAGGADTWQEATRVHTDTREGRHVARGVGIWRAHGLVMDIMWPISQSHVYQSCLCSF